MVVTTVTIALTVLAGNVVPGMIEAGSVKVDSEVTAPVLLTYDPETSVKIVFGNNIVSCDTTPETVLGDMVTAGTTLSGIVVVYV